MEQYTFIPFVSVGIFVFNSNIQKYLPLIASYDFLIMPDTNTQRYYIDEMGLRISCENDLIDSITCDKYCFYKGHNLIGMTIHQCKKILSAIPTTHEYLWVSDTERQSVYTFDCLGLMLWFSKRRLVTVICMRYIEDD